MSKKGENLRIKQADGNFKDLKPITITNAVLREKDQKPISDIIDDRMIYNEISSFLYQTILDRNWVPNVNYASLIYSWDRNNPKDDEEFLIIKDDTYLETYGDLYYTLFITNPKFSKIFNTSYKRMFLILIDNTRSYTCLCMDNEYEGINTLCRTNVHTIGEENSYITTINNIRYPYKYSENSGHQNFSGDTYDPECNTLEIKLSLDKEYADIDIDDIKIYHIMYEETPAKDNNVDKIVEYINEEYGYDYELKFSAEFDFRCIHRKAWNSDYYMFGFSKTTNCIIDWGDGCIEKFEGITSADHNYNRDNTYKYNINIYSNEYLWISRISGGMCVINKIDLSQHTSLKQLLGYNHQTTLNCPINITNVNNIARAFNYVTNLDTSIFDKVKNITSLNNTFCGNAWMTEIPTNLDTSKVTDWYCAFQCMPGITHIPALDTTAATRANAIFFDSCRIQTMEELDFCNATTLESCFAACHSLVEAKLKNTSKVTDFGEMFYDCVSLESISELDITSVDITWNDTYEYYEGLYEVFTNCNKLRNVKLVGEATADKIDTFISILPTYIIDGVTKQIDISGCVNKDAVTATKETWTIIK